MARPNDRHARQACSHSPNPGIERRVGIDEIDPMAPRDRKEAKQGKRPKKALEVELINQKSGSTSFFHQLAPSRHAEDYFVPALSHPFRFAENADLLSSPSGRCL